MVSAVNSASASVAQAVAAENTEPSKAATSSRSGDNPAQADASDSASAGDKADAKADSGSKAADDKPGDGAAQSRSDDGARTERGGGRRDDDKGDKGAQDGKDDKRHDVADSGRGRNGRSADTRPTLPSARDTDAARDDGNWLKAVHDFFIPPANAQGGRYRDTSAPARPEATAGNPKDLSTAVAEREAIAEPATRQRAANLRAELATLEQQGKPEPPQDPLNRRMVYAGIDGQPTAVTVTRNEAGKTVVAYANHQIEVGARFLDREGRVEDDQRLVSWLRAQELRGDLGADVRSLDREQLRGSTAAEKQYLTMQLAYLEGASEDSAMTAKQYVALRRELLPQAPAESNGDESLRARAAFRALPKDVREEILRYDQSGSKPDFESMKQDSMSVRYGALLARLDADKTYGAGRQGEAIQAEIDQLLKSTEGQLRLDENLVRVGYQHGSGLTGAVPQDKRPIETMARTYQSATNDFNRDLSQFAGGYARITGMSAEQLNGADHRTRVVALTEARTYLAAQAQAQGLDPSEKAQRTEALQQFDAAMTQFVARSGLNLGRSELKGTADRVTTVTQLDVSATTVKREVTQDFLNVTRSSDLPLRA